MTCTQSKTEVHYLCKVLLRCPVRSQNLWLPASSPLRGLHLGGTKTSASSTLIKSIACNALGNSWIILMALACYRSMMSVIDPMATCASQLTQRSSSVQPRQKCLVTGYLLTAKAYQHSIIIHDSCERGCTVKEASRRRRGCIQLSTWTSSISQ